MIANFDVTPLSTGELMATLVLSNKNREEGDMFYLNRSYVTYPAASKKIRLGNFSSTSLDVKFEVTCEKRER
jgi:hypothetical protein